MNKYPIVIAGAGGGKGGGGARAAQEAANTLRSKQIAHVVDLLGEGEWEGIVDGPGGIYLNDIPLFSPTNRTNNVVALTEANSDGSWPVAGKWNYKGVTVEYRGGTQAQTAIRTISTAASADAVATPVTQETPISAAITNPEYDLAVVNVTVNSLYQQNPNNGDISGWFVDVKIRGRQQGGSWQTFHNDRIQGKTMTPYTRSYPVDLSIMGVGPWEVQVIRVSANDPDQSKHSEILFASVQSYTREKFRYPNSVICAVGIDSSQLTSVPTRAYDVKMMRVRIPSNYNPTTRAYTGVWDGSFTIAWTDNPAWCLYEMATNTRFGLGEYFDEELLDKWSLYTIAQYCDQLVPNGFGGQEPRFTMNCYIQSSADAIELIQNMASVFRGIIYYMGGNLVAVQDAPADPVYIFNRSNVIDGKFSYAGASGAARHTVAMVVWNNPAIQYKQDIEYVEDPEGLLKFGYRPTTITAFGCTSRGQAHRLGAWALYVEQYESDVVTFQTALEGTGIAPGKIIEIHDPARAGARFGGRIIDVTSLGGNVYRLSLDGNGPNLTAGETYTLSFINNNGQIVRKTVGPAASTAPHPVLDVTIATAADVPVKGSIWGIEGEDIVPQLFRITSIMEKDGVNYEIIAVSHHPDKYAHVEQGLSIEERPTSVTNINMDAVGGFQFTESLYILGDETMGIRLTTSWAQQQYAVGYMVAWRRGSDSWSPERFISNQEFVLNPVQEDIEYTFRVAAVSILGKKGIETEATYRVLGEKAPPPPFDVFNAMVQPDGTRQFEWGYTTTQKPVDFKGARIRYTPGNVVIPWEDMVPLENQGFFSYSPVETNQLLSGEYVVACCAEDRTANLSTPVYAIITLPDRRLGSVLAEYDEQKLGWTGTRSGCRILNGAGEEKYIEANDTSTWATAPATWDGWTRWNVNPTSPITYTSVVRDLIAIMAGLLEVNVDADGTVLVEMRTSNDNVTWSAWATAGQTFTARYFQIRVTVTATGGAPVPIIRDIIVQVGGKLKKETRNDLVPASLTGSYRIGVGDIRVPLANAFVVISRVTVLAIQDANPGWTWLLKDKDTTTGPRMQFYKNGVLADPAAIDVYLEGY